MFGLGVAGMAVANALHERGAAGGIRRRSDRQHFEERPAIGQIENNLALFRGRERPVEFKQARLLAHRGAGSGVPTRKIDGGNGGGRLGGANRREDAEEDGEKDFFHEHGGAVRGGCLQTVLSSGVPAKNPLDSGGPSAAAMILLDAWLHAE